MESQQAHAYCSSLCEPNFSFNSDDYLTFPFISSALNICILLGFFFDKILKLKFNSNCPQEANNVVFAAILPMNFPVSFPNRDNSSTFFYICEIVSYPLFFFLSLLLSISFISIDIHPNSYFLLYCSGESLPYFVSTAGYVLSSKPTCPPRNLSALQD